MKYYTKCNNYNSYTQQLTITNLKIITAIVMYMEHRLKCMQDSMDSMEGIMREGWS